MTLCHSDAEKHFKEQLKERKALELKYFRLRKTVRARWECELEELRKKEQMERWALDPLEVPSWYWNA